MKLRFKCTLNILLLVSFAGVAGAEVKTQKAETVVQAIEMDKAHKATLKGTTMESEVGGTVNNGINEKIRPRVESEDGGVVTKEGCVDTTNVIEESERDSDVVNLDYCCRAHGCDFERTITESSGEKQCEMLTCDCSDISSTEGEESAVASAVSSCYETLDVEDDAHHRGASDGSGFDAEYSH